MSALVSFRTAVVAMLALLCLAGMPAVAEERGPKEVLSAFGAAFVDGADGFSETEALIDDLAATGDERVAETLRALSEGDLMVRKADGAVFIARKRGKTIRLLDALTREPSSEGSKRELKKVRVKNAIRRRIDAALSGLTLSAPNPLARLRAAETIFARGDRSALEALEAALEEETNAEVREAMNSARASALLSGDVSDEEAEGAIAVVTKRGDRKARARLISYAATAPEPLAGAAREGVARIDRGLAAWASAQNVWYGVSLGSVLFLAAIGLAITFGVMGVINMAHGEMVMLGAYTTFVVQELIRTSAPGLFDASLLVALPLAFLVAGAVGLLIERGVIRFLYGRPLETLLATWGISLVLQQAVRTVFGPTNREVGNPSWMSGGFEIGQLAITWSRLWIVLFSLAVFVALLAIVKRSSLGLKMRAVTQNRPMAASMGIRTPWVDALTFALGSGIAGIAGVALSQIDNVSPNLGQGYIIDAFLVVVFGGVGNLWGTLVGALSLGVLNKFLEPYAGAVLAKILVLVLIILFIQKRPRGLFALRGRAAEA